MCVCYICGLSTDRRLDRIYEIASLGLHSVSDESRFTTGQIQVIDNKLSNEKPAYAAKLYWRNLVEGLGYISCFAISIHCTRQAERHAT